MATYRGKDGHIRIGGTNVVANLTQFEFTETGDTVETTVLGDTWRTHAPTQQSWEGGGSGYYDRTDATGQELIDVGSSIAIGFYPEGVNTTGDVVYSGTGVVTSVKRSLQYEGNVEFEFTCKGNGALTRTVT
jgi:hypothetical protein